MHNWLKKIKLIVWDLDGTLYPTNPDFSNEIQSKKIDKVAHHLSCSTQQAEIKFNKILKQTSSNTKTLDILGMNGTRFFVDLWQEISLNLYIQKNPKLIEMFSKISPLPQAMLTNSNSRKNIQKKLNIIGLKPEQFVFIITSVEVGYSKPHPKIFEELIKKSQLLPKEIIYVGDREKTDIIPAKKLGIKTCIVNSVNTSADLEVSTPVELLEMFL